MDSGFLLSKQLGLFRRNKIGGETMTYRELLAILMHMRAKNLEDDVTVCVDDEYFPALIRISQEDDVLDRGHYYLEVRK